MSRATNQQIAQGFAQGLQNFTQGYIKRKDKEAAKVILEDTNSTPVQKALAWESLAEGSGPKVYDTILKEQALKKQEERDQSIANELFPGQSNKQDVGQRAGVGTLDPVNSEMSPVQQAQQGAFPGYKNFGQQQNEQPAEQVENNAGLNGAPQPEQVEQDQQQPQRNISNIPTQELQGMLGTTKNKDLQKVIQSELGRRNVETKANAIKESAQISANQKDRSFALQVNDPYNKRIAGLKASTPVRSRAVQFAKEAVRSGEVGKLSINHIADVLKMPSLKTATGTKLDQAIKTNLIGTLSEVTAKATNIFLEKVALDAFARPGQSQEANLMKLEALDTELKLNSLETQIYDEMLKKDIEQFGSEQPYLELRVSEAVKPLQEDIIKGASWKMRKYEEAEKSYEQLYKKALKPVSNGTPLSKQMGRILLDKVQGDKDRAAALAERLGYTIYSTEDIKRYEQQ